jgi:hypothetical protein
LATRPCWRLMSRFCESKLEMAHSCAVMDRQLETKALHAWRTEQKMWPLLQHFGSRAVLRQSEQALKRRKALWARQRAKKLRCARRLTLSRRGSSECRRQSSFARHSYAAVRTAPQTSCERCSPVVGRSLTILAVPRPVQGRLSRSRLRRARLSHDSCDGRVSIMWYRLIVSRCCSQATAHKRTRTAFERDVIMSLRGGQIASPSRPLFLSPTYVSCRLIGLN